MKKDPGGRPTKLTQELIKQVCEGLLRGSYIETAFEWAGVPKETYYHWMRQGRARPKSIYGKLLHSASKAMAESEMYRLTLINRAATGSKAVYGQDEEGNRILLEPAIKPDWKAAAWITERRNPKMWGPRQTIEHAMPEPEAKKSLEELQAEAKRLEEQLKACEDV